MATAILLPQESRPRLAAAPSHSRNRMDAEQGWTVVYRAGSRHEAELVRGRLEEHEITAVVMDQGSFAYPQLSEVTVLVAKADVMRALYLVRQAPEA